MRRNNFVQHTLYEVIRDQVLNYKTESILVSPVKDNDGHIIGALELLNKDTGCFNDADVALIEKQAQTLGGKDTPLADMGIGEAKTLVQQLMNQTSTERGSIFIIDQNTGHLYSLYAHGLEEPNIQLNLKLGIAGLVAVSGQVLRNNFVQHTLYEVIRFRAKP